MGIAAPLPPSGRAAGEGVGLAVACPVPGQGGVGSGQGSLGGSHPELTGVKAAHRMDRSQADLTHTGGRTGEGMADVGGIAEEEEQDELEEYALLEEQGVEPGLRLQSVIPHGKKYERRWLLGSLQSVCIRPFNPIHYYTEGSRVQFYLQDAAAAEALSRVSRQITDTQGYKVTVLMNPCPPPAFTHSDLTARGLEQLQRCLAKRYDELQRALDLSSIRTDPDLVSQSVDVILNRKTCMQAVIKIIQENITELVSLNLSHNRLFKTDDVAELVTKVPSLRALNLSHNQLKSERDLDKLKVQRLEELWLDRNPVCDLFKDQHSYISAIRQRFPQLLKLDGHELPAPIGFDVETGAVAPPCKGSYFGSDEVKSLILHFLQQYYSVYDSGDRQPLLDAYHDGACFSLCLPIIQNPARCTLGEYHKHSRNLRNVRDSTLRFRLLKHTRLQVVTFLNELPKTQHDTASFIIDVNTHTSALLCFTVSGVFKEVEGRCRDSVRAFSRVFITVPAGNSGMCVVSEELFVRSATAQDVNRAFAAPGPTPASSPTLSGSSTPVLSTPQQEMLSAFTLQSGMNQEWSQKCLQDNDWDFQQAAQIFSQLKAQGKIPGVAFIR